MLCSLRFAVAFMCFVVYSWGSLNSWLAWLACFFLGLLETCVVYMRGIWIIYSCLGCVGVVCFEDCSSVLGILMN